MEKLISFITSNFYFVIVAVGIIYSLFFRKSPLERPPNRMPDFVSAGQQRPRKPGESSPSVAPTSSAEPQEVRFPASQRQNPPPQQRQEQPVRVRTRPVEQRQTPTMPTLTESDVSYSGGAPERQATVTRPSVTSQPIAPVVKNRLDARGLTRDDLARAVVWAEILGPPRARRPHRR